MYALNILTDDELRESLKAQIDAEKPQTAGERYAIGAQKIGQWIPLILKKHRGRPSRRGVSRNSIAPPPSLLRRVAPPAGA